MNRIEYFRKSVLMTIIICLFSVVLMAQQVVTGRFNIMVEENMKAQLEAYPQEKIHLHTDRDVYIPGEKIWFKAYVVDANSHLYPTYSQYVYVEMISPADTLVKRVMITQTEGIFHGHLPISGTVPEGNYTLRAYTRYMENSGDDYFFKKNIRIENLTSVKNQHEEIAQRNRSRSAPTEIEDFDVTFFPEGGNLLEGVACKVAFKALNRNGYPETVSGKITDENGIELASVKSYHAGMGVFVYLPEQGKKYYMRCVNENGLEKQFELPRPNPVARSLAVSMPEKRILIGVQKSVHAHGIPCYLLIHSRGTVLHFSEWDTKRIVSLMEEELPAGVTQIVLFDGQMNPLSERLIFNKNDNAIATVEFHTDKEVYEKREKVSASLQSPSLSGRAGEGLSHFSVAITDDNDIAVDKSTTILSSLLLSSELKGYIENPAYYLQDAAAMDLLMMTHGWRRYNIPEVAKGHLESPQIPFQQYQEISGRVTTPTVFNRPVPDSEILILMKGNDGSSGFVAMSTDGNGSFIVPKMDFPDSTTFIIRALDKKERENVRLNVTNESFPALLKAPVPIIPVSVAEAKDDPGNGAFMEKAEQRAKFDEDIWTLHIEEIKITAPKPKKVEPRSEFYLNASSSRTITRKEMDEFKSLFLHTHLEFAGVDVSEDIYTGLITFFIRGSFNLTTKIPALVFIDGMLMGEFYRSSLEVDEVESIDIIKGLGASALGTRGAGGAISFTTRRGGIPIVEKNNYVVFNPVGWQKPVEFYSPKYDTLEAKQSVIPDLRTTVFWKPDVVISEDGKVTLEFYTSDFRTSYSVVIEGITSDGRIVRQVEKIRVE